MCTVNCTFDIYYAFYYVSSFSFWSILVALYVTCDISDISEIPLYPVQSGIPKTSEGNFGILGTSSVSGAFGSLDKPGQPVISSYLGHLKITGISDTTKIPGLSSYLKHTANTTRISDFPGISGKLKIFLSWLSRNIKNISWLF